MIALPAKADMFRVDIDVRLVPEADLRQRSGDQDFREGTGRREPRVSRKCSHVTELAVNLIVRV